MITNRNRLKLLGTEVEECKNSTKLEDKILGLFQDVEAHKQCQNVVLISITDFGSALSKACKHDTDSDAIHLARTANIVKKDMLKIKN